jgi:putative peptide zinc metalloprotease protein
MSVTIFSDNWYRVANLKPRLRSHGHICRHIYRGRDWYVLQDKLSGRYHRLSPEAYHVVGLMNGKLTMQEIWQAACAHLGDDMPTQDEIIGLMTKLHQADILQARIPPDIKDLYFRYNREQKKKILAILLSPMSVRFPLFDPDKLLTLLNPLSKVIFSYFGAIVWVLTVVTALSQVIIHWPELTENLTDRVLATENLILLWFVYPVIKIVHELGHGCAVKRWGGEVHETGIMLLVLMPIPYVDASSSLAFVKKWRRIIVSGAGIMVELFLAATAIIVWVNVEPGLVRSLAFNVVLIAGISTVLFNGNPLLRFDGYYVFSDLLEIPNLGSRSNKYIGYLLRRYVLNIPDQQTPASTPGEAFWLGTYGPAAFIYRILVSIRIAIFVAGKFFFIGISLAIWATYNSLLTPLVQLLKQIGTDPSLSAFKGRIALAFGCACGFGITTILLLPMPYFTLAEGVVQTPEQGVVYSGGDGFVAELIAVPGQKVLPGEPLLRCANPEIDAKTKEAAARLAEYQARLEESIVRDRTEARILKDEVERINSELIWLQGRQAALLVKSPGEGIFVMLNPNDILGRFVRQGSPLGYVADYDRMVVQALVTQEEVDKIRNDTIRLTARLASNIDRELPAVIKRQVPAASQQLPSMVLSLNGGGKIALDPKEKDRPMAFSSMFRFELSLPEVSLARIDERIFVRFEHSSEPLAYRWYRSIRRLLLSRFEI